MKLPLLPSSPPRWSRSIFLSLLSLAVGHQASALYSESFDTADSLTGWSIAGDSLNETAITWLDQGGNPGGALQYGGYHNGEGGGRGYVLTTTIADTDFSAASTLSFDAKLTGASVGANVQVQILLNGVASGFASLSNSGLNDATWTEFSYDVSAVQAGSTSLTLNFLVAAGAFEGAGALIAIDNLSVAGSAGGGDGNGDGGDPDAALIRTVDPSAPWTGYMNVFELAANGGGFAFGNAWGAVDLIATFAGDSLTLSPNTNTYNATDAFWVDPVTLLGNKRMNANFHVESTALIGQTLTFRGTVEANTLTSDYTSVAVIKVLDSAAGYSEVARIEAPLVTGESFSLTLEIGDVGTYIPQYGFETNGPNAAPGNAFGSVVVGPYVASGDGDGDGNGGDPSPTDALFTETFDTADALTGWTIAGDPFSETAITWLDQGGNPGGALQFGGYHNGEGGGRGYVLTYTIADTDFTAAETLSFDAKLTGASEGANVQVQILLNGVPSGFASLSNEGLNNATWTDFTYDISAVEAGSNSLTLNLLVAAGAFEGAGALIAIDNLVVSAGEGSGDGDGDGNGDGDGEIVTLFSSTFDAAASVNDWGVNGDGLNETSVTWLDQGGNPSGALQFVGYHNGTGDGRGYILTSSVTRVDLSGARTLSFDAKITGEAVGTNLQVQILLDGVPAGFASLTNNGLNADAWTNFSYDLSGVTPGSENLTLNFLVAAGAFEGAGISFALDNLTVSGISSGEIPDGPEPLFVEEFSTTESISDWTVSGGMLGETTLSWLSEGGIPGGALQFAGFHDGTGAGRGFILSKTISGINLSGATELSFDARITGDNVGADLQVQIILPGVPAGFASLSAAGLNSLTWTAYSYDISTVEAGSNTLTVNFLLAAGAFEGAGLQFAIDNLTIEGTPTDGDGDGDGDGSLLYLGFPVEAFFADTGSWLDLIQIEFAPWAYKADLGWIWIAEETYTPQQGGWVYVPEFE